MSAERLLLCRPQGGLNDMLCQIEKACRYAERFGRTVVVETDCRFTGAFQDSMANYFVSQQERLVLDAGEIQGLIDVVDVRPGFASGRVSQCEARYDAGVSNFVDVVTGLPLTFDFNVDHAERLLLHHQCGSHQHQCGGAQLSLGALARMRLHPRVSDMLFDRLTEIGPFYTGIHIRNTDIRSNYQQFVRELANDIAGPILLATDNRETLTECRSILGESRVYSFSRLPSQPGQRLHCTNGFDDRFRLNADAILDVVMLGLSTNYYAAELERTGYSGFSQLAAALHSVRPLISRLITTKDRAFDAMPWPLG